jgi:polysaccharide biosynthesis protein PslH
VDAGRVGSQRVCELMVTALHHRAAVDTERAADLRCLWIGRYIPYPMNEGAKVYSAKLAESLAQAGAFVRVLGFGGTDAVPADRPRMEWMAVPGERRNAAAGIFSRLPLTAAIDSVPAYASLLEAQLREPWDAIVFDGYGTGWALERCLAYRAARSAVLVHVSHNHESSLWRAMARQAKTSLPRRLALWQNYLKVSALERRLVRHADLVTAITAEDERSLQAHREDGATLVLTPGYDGATAAERIIDATTARCVAIVGSFHWVVKRENLARFIAHADPVFAEHGIQLVVAGDMPAELQESLRARCRATRLEGFLADLRPLLSQARLAVVPELIGGGFKLKFLDYFFARVPVATVAAAAAGLPASLRQQMLTSEDFAGLTAAIVQHIDRVDLLNRLQLAAFEQARTLYRWEDRGRQLQQQIAGLRHAALAPRAALQAESQISTDDRHES